MRCSTEYRIVHFAALQAVRRAAGMSRSRRSAQAYADSPYADSPYAASSSLIPWRKPSMSSSVVSKEHIQRTSPGLPSQS
jgi:hypothetical protein